MKGESIGWIGDSRNVMTKKEEVETSPLKNYSFILKSHAFDLIMTYNEMHRPSH